MSRAGTVATTEGRPAAGTPAQGGLAGAPGTNGPWREAARVAPDPRLDHPVIIVGPLRAGTTLLRLVLDHHPSIALFDEFEESVSRLGDTGWLDVVEYRAWLRTSRMFLDKGLAIDESIGEYPALVRDFFRQMAGGTPKAVVGFTIHSRFDRAMEIWPGARLIHITRDPRDVARSCIGMGWCGTVWHGAHFWLESEGRFARLKERLAPGSWIEVRYEDLVRGAEQTVRRCCAFLGVEFEASMLEFHKDTSYEPIDPRLAEQWRKKLTRRQVELVESRCAGLMRGLGYELSGAGGGVPRGPGMAEWIGLWWRNRWGKTRFRMKRYGPGLVVAWALVKRLPTGNSLRTAVRGRINRVDSENLK